MAKIQLSLMECFVELVDRRIERSKRQSLEVILTLAVLAVITGAEGWEDTEEVGESKHEWWKLYLQLSHGIPSHDTISHLFR